MFRRMVITATGVLAVAVLSGCGPTTASSPGSASRLTPSTGQASPTSPSMNAPQTSPGSGTGGVAPTSSSSTPQVQPTSPAVTPGPAPTLGLEDMGGAFSNTRGFGQVRPAVVDNGGDPTGLITGVTWATWGGETADGQGTGTYVGPGQAVAEGTQVSVKIRAYDLTTCDGHPAYRHVIWWFPSKGETYEFALGQHVEDYDLCNAS